MTDLSSKMKILGKPAFIPKEDILHKQRIGRISFKVDTVNPRFLYYFLMTEMVSSEIRRTATGTMVRHTAPKRILNIDMAFPKDREEQEALVENLDSLRHETRRLKIVHHQKLAALAELIQSLLQKAFSGKLAADKADDVAQEGLCTVSEAIPYTKRFMLGTLYTSDGGVDARTVRHIVLMRPINSMIEFKQIIGRGTCLPWRP